MKNQNDMIVMIVAAVLGLGVGLGFFFAGKRTVNKPADPQPVPVAAAKPQEGSVVMANGLPGASGGSGGGGSTVGGNRAGGRGGKIMGLGAM
ncbi:MAG: hypothetical protein JSS66_12450 [Armatimonadetes bacterium]|nr:hypothetical protein [Armatimonadota bacterium]